MNYPRKHHSDLKTLLKGLINGDWIEEKSVTFKAVRIWKEKNSGKHIFSVPTFNDKYMIWEVVKTVALQQYLQIGATTIEPDYRPFTRPHIIIHDHCDFPGGFPEVRLTYKGDTYDLEGDIPSGYDSAMLDTAEELVLTEELNYLSKSLISPLLRGEQTGLPIHMTGEQAEVLGYYRSEHSPTLLSGEAGSGKTTVITHWLIINHMESPTNDPVRQLFVTFSDRLVDKTRQEFERMLPPSRANHEVEFLTYRDLLMKDIAGFGGLSQFIEENEMTFERFMREYSKKRIERQLDPVLVWDEIRSVIKGGAEEGRRIIDFPTYQKLSEARGHCKTPEYLREAYYGAAQAYQNYLDREGLWDSVDLANRCLELTEKDIHARYERIACDEVQDLAPAEIRLLIRLIKDREINGIFFTGDIAQVINPSGFSWNRLKGNLGRISREVSREMIIQDAWSLEQNFRSSAEIVEVVNEVLKVRNSILGRFETGERRPQKSKRQTKQKPLILEESPLPILLQSTSNPQKRMILAKNNDIKEKLEKQLARAWANRGESRQVTVLTVEEAKGLEWEGVLLWNFFIPRHEQISRNDWKEFFVQELRRAFPEQIDSGEKHPYGLNYEFNLLHVGLTRARDLLFFYDESPEMQISSISPKIESLTTKADMDLFQTMWRTDPASAEEIYELASKLLEKDRDQAILLFKEAALKFDETKNLLRAAESYEKAGAFKQAAECYKARQDFISMERALALFFRGERSKEKEGDQWKRYAERCLEANRLQDALDGFEKSIVAYESVRIFSKAAMTTEEKAHHLSDPVRQVAALKDAVKLWQDANETTDAIRVLEEMLNLGRQKRLDESDRNIGGVTPSVFFAEYFDLLGKLIAKLAKSSKEKDDYSRAADASMNAARMYSEARAIASSSQKKKDYRRFQVENINTGVEHFIAAGRSELAIDSQTELLGIVIQDREDSDIVISVSEKLCELLRNNENSKELFTTIENVWGYLSKKKEYRSLYDLLEVNIDWLQENHLFSLARKLLEWLKKCYIEEGKPLGTAEALERDAIILAELDNVSKAVKRFSESTKYFIEARKLQRAEEVLESAYNLLKSRATQSDVGWFCFHEAALGRLLREAMRRKDERRPWELAIRWLQRGAIAFSNDFDYSHRRLIGLAAQAKDEIKILSPALTREQELDLEREKFRLALTNLCLAITIDTLLAGNTEKMGRKLEMERNTAFFHAIEHFEGCCDEPGPRIVLDLTRSKSPPMDILEKSVKLEKPLSGEEDAHVDRVEDDQNEADDRF